MHQADKILPVNVLHLRVVVGRRQMRVDGVGATGQVQVAAGDAAVTHRFIVGGVAQVLFLQAADVEGQAVDLLGGHQLTVIGRR